MLNKHQQNIYLLTISHLKIEKHEKQSIIIYYISKIFIILVIFKINYTNSTFLYYFWKIKNTISIFFNTF